MSRSGTSSGGKIGDPSGSGKNNKRSLKLQKKHSDKADPSLYDQQSAPRVDEANVFNQIAQIKIEKAELQLQGTG